MREDGEDCLGDAGAGGGGLAAAELDVVLAGLVQHGVDLLVVVVVVVDPQQALGWRVEHGGIISVIYLNIAPDRSVEFSALFWLVYDTLSTPELVI